MAGQVVAMKKKATAPAAAPEFDINAILGGAAKPQESKSGSKTPVLTVGDDVKEIATKLRTVKGELDSAEAQFELLKSELVEKVTGARAELCKTGYHSTVRVPDAQGLSVSVTWSGSYSKVGIEKKDAIEGVVGERFEEFFSLVNEIKVRPEACGNQEMLTELIAAIGPERFAQFFEVSRTIKPTERYTTEFFTAFDEEQRTALSQVVKQYSPSIKTK